MFFHGLVEGDTGGLLYVNAERPSIPLTPHGALPAPQVSGLF
jgi:hypothetical protein